jgi:hypothetical protein
LARLYDDSGEAAKARHHYEEFVASTANLIDGAGNCECNCDLIAKRAEIVKMLAEDRPAGTARRRRVVGPAASTS